MPTKLNKRKPAKGFTHAQVKAAVQARDGAGTRTPTIVIDAFLPEKIAAGQFPFQPANMARMMQLQLAAPGLLKEKEPDKFDLREVANALFIFSQDEDLCEALLGNRVTGDDGKVRFPDFEAAVFQLAKKVDPATLVTLGAMIDQALVAAMKPAVPFGASKSTPGDSPFPAAPTPGQGSGGSSH